MLQPVSMKSPVSRSNAVDLVVPDAPPLVEEYSSDELSGDR